MSEPDVQLPQLSAVGWLRWTWRQLTSMRTALLLLMLLAVAAVPGSVFPQQRIDPSQVDGFLARNPQLGAWLQRLGMFDVYGSPWFSAVYLLLFVSLVGCVLPRTGVHLRALRAAPPAAPRRLERMPAFVSVDSSTPAAQVLAAARTVLRARRYRVAPPPPDDEPAADSVAAERGYSAETGNLLFHLALLAVLVTVAVGSFVSYSGQSIVVTGQTWSNTLLAYDSFEAGQAVDPQDLPPFSVTLDDLAVRFEEQPGQQFGAARDFQAAITYRAGPTQAARKMTVRVNEPLSVSGASVYLVGNGYAPVVSVRDAKGRLVFSGPTPFRPQDGQYTSDGVIKVPDGLAEQVGFSGMLLPTAARLPTGQPVSVFPDLRNPLLILTGWRGDLGLDDGVAQSVYALDVSRMQQLSVDGAPWSRSLTPGQSVPLPDDLGTLTFDGVQRYAALETRADPTARWVLVFALLALLGLTLSLFVRRRRIWVRAHTDNTGRTVVQVAGLARSEDARLAAEVATVLGALPVGSRPGPAA